MTAITDSGYNGVDVNYPKAASRTKQYPETMRLAGSVTESSPDRVELSPEALAFSQSLTTPATQEIPLGDQYGPSVKGRIQQAMKADPAQKERFDKAAEAISGLIEKAKETKLDLYAHIKAILKKNGLGLEGSDRLKLEIAKDGKILVGGVKDKTRAKAIEKALNNEIGLSEKIRKNQDLQSELSVELRSVTNQSLWDLKRTSLDMANKKSPYPEDQNKPKEKYGDVPDDFLAVNPEIMKGLKEVFEHGDIDFSTERPALTEPKATIENILKDVWNALSGMFADYNKKLEEEMGQKYAGISSTGGKNTPLIDEEFKAQHFLSMHNVKITVDSEGNIKVTGKTAGAESSNAKGREIIEEELQKALHGKDGEFSVFELSSERILADYEDIAGGQTDEAPKIEATIEKAVSTTVRVASPKREAKLKDEIGEEVNSLVAMSGIQIDSPLKIEISPDGRIKAENLPLDANTSKRIEVILDSLNAMLEDPETDKFPNDPALGAVKSAMTKIMPKMRELAFLLPNGLSQIQCAKQNNDPKPVPTQKTKYSVVRDNADTAITGIRE